MSMVNAPASQNSSVGMMEVMDSTLLALDYAGDRARYVSCARALIQVQARGLRSNSSQPLS
jgi:hypothetical protein